MERSHKVYRRTRKIRRLRRKRKTKICSKLTCPHKGKRQLANQFRYDKRNTDKLGSWCKTCLNIQGKGWRDNNQDSIRSARIAFKKLNPSYWANWWQNDRQDHLEKQKIYRQNNHNTILESNRKYINKNRDKIRAQDAERRAREIQATPKWTNKHIRKILAKIYSRVSRKNKRVADHIIPLKNKLVAGLHVPWNLQILSLSNNCKKLNKFNLITINIPYYINSNILAVKYCDKIVKRKMNKLIDNS